MANSANTALDEHTAHLLQNALALPESQRALLVAHLLDSVEDAKDPGYDDYWDDEIKRRLALDRAGEAEYVTWDELKAQLLGKLRAKRESA